MKIFFLTSTFYPSIGGVEVGIHNLAINMSNLGNQVYVVCPFQSIYIPKKFQLPYKVIPLPPKFFYFVKFIEFPPIKLIYSIYYYILFKIYKPEFWHISMSYPAGFSFLQFSKFSNSPYLIMSVGVDIQINKESSYGFRLNKNINKLFVNYFRSISNHVAASSCLETQYRELGVKNEKIYRIPNGVDLKRFNIKKNSVYKNNNEFINLVSVGRNEPKKNYKKLIDCFEVLQKKSNNKYKLKIVGSKVMNLKSYLNKNKVPYVELIEPSNYNSKNNSNKLYCLPSRDIINAYLKADIFVFSSLIESFGIVVLEAMAAGLPIVAFDVLGINELVKNNYNGKLVEANNINNFADAIISISKKVDLERMSQNSKNLSRKYDWSKISIQYYNLYLKIINEK